MASVFSGGGQVVSSVSAHGFYQFVEDYGADVENILLGTAFIIYDVQRELCPVDTGDLRSTIHIQEFGPHDLAVIEGNDDVNYGPFVEDGTEDQASQPHARPAAAAGRQWQMQQYQALKARYG